MELMPAIDLLAGRCVRLYQGDFGRVTAYDADPVDLARSYRDAGARRLHVVDLDGARHGTAVNLEVIRAIAGESGAAVQAGGGVRTGDTVDAFFAAGVERAVIGSVAVTDAPMVREWMTERGSGRFVLAFDVRIEAGKSDPVAVVHGWQKSSGRRLWDLLEEYVAAGAADFLCTDVGRDGTLAGPNVPLYAECVRRYPGARFIASGGLSGPADLAPLAATGVDAVVAGKALLDGRLPLTELRRFSRAG
jgi:phosphoribosylformimino-5-aminoimidazole carboxamide ribotide isomerase